MAPKHVEPAIDLKSFSCLHCGALAAQTWYSLFAQRLENNRTPWMVTESDITYFSHPCPDGEAYELQPTQIAELQRALTGDVFLEDASTGESNKWGIVNVHTSECFSCERLTIWKHKSVLWPPRGLSVAPNADLPEDIIADFEEARIIVDLSPRGAAALLRLCIQKICVHLGLPGNNINDDIKRLVEKGLDSRVQQALDIVRVTGNNAVHPGQIDFKDNPEIAHKLFDLVNGIARDMISLPKELASFYHKLPPGTLDAIQKRDKPKKS